MILGKVVSTQAHYLYQCQVFRSREVAHPPIPEDYAFGNFVAVVVKPELQIVGVICDTLLNNPAYGRLGPRLSSDTQLEILTPDYLDEVSTEITIFALGTLQASQVSHRMPRVAPQVGNTVRLLSDDEVAYFHGLPDSVRMGYFGRIVGERRPVFLELGMAVLERLISLAPDRHKAMLAVQLDDLRWRLTVEPK